MVFLPLLGLGPAKASEPQVITGTSSVFVDASGAVEVDLDTAPADGIVDRTWVFVPDSPITIANTFGDATVVISFYSETLGRLILDDSAGRLHLDLATTYDETFVQPAGSAEENVVARGPVLRYLERIELSGTTTLSSRNISVATGVLMSRVDASVTRYAAGNVLVSSALLMRGENDAGHDEIIPTDPDWLAAIRMGAQEAYDRGASGVYSPQSCYTDCMADRDCEIESLVGGTTAALAVELTVKKTGWGIVAGGAGAATCWAANAVGCNIGCAVAPPPNDCPPGSMCKNYCGAFENEVGVCELSETDQGVCCLRLCFNPPFQC